MTKNSIKGGKADKMSAEEIAKKFNVSVDKIKAQIKKGVDIEIEHTGDKEKATEIAMDHLTEFPDYYDRLEKMENKAKKELKFKNESLVKKLVRKYLKESVNSFISKITAKYPNFFNKVKQNPNFVLLEPNQVITYPFSEAKSNKCETNVFLFCKERGSHMLPVGGFLFERDNPIEHWWVYDSMLNQYLEVTPFSGPKSDIIGYAGIVEKNLGEKIKKANNVFDIDFFKSGNVYTWYFKN
jgi:hypothetical protein